MSACSVSTSSTSSVCSRGASMGASGVSTSGGGVVGVVLVEHALNLLHFG